MTEKTIAEIIACHQSSGRFEIINGVKIFALDQGSGEAVFCIHGVPTSSFLYRNVVKEVSTKGFRGIAIDLPGLGLSDRPNDFSYCFSNLAVICNQFLNQIDVKQYHLVIHDIGAPIGLALAAQNKEKIKSITVLNSMLDIKNFKKPLPMRPFEIPVLGEAELAMMNHFTWKLMMKAFGVEDVENVPEKEMDAYMDILKREDNGKAFLTIMRNFEQTEELNKLCFSAIQNVPYPIQIIWGKNDPLLTFEEYGKQYLKAAPAANVFLVNGKHFVQEENAAFIADKIMQLAKKKR